jgi:predicted DNA-binding protein (MmcQ/YjbR family)
VRAYCLTLPYTKEKVRWGHNLLFCVADKIYCVANLEPGNGPSLVTFKCTPEKFRELVEIEGVIPAPYMARNHWVTVTDLKNLRQEELKGHIEESYQLVVSKIPRRTLESLSASGRPARRIKRKKSKRAF